MRWKLILIASFVAALASLGVLFFITSGSLDATNALASRNWLTLVLLPIPALLAFGASFFVYRHTARRRPLQAMTTALLTALLILTTMLVFSLFFRKPMPETLPPSQPRNVG